MIKITRRGLLIAVLIILVAGKLLARVFPLAGAIVEALALGVYLVFRARCVFATMGRFRVASGSEKTRAVVWFAVLFVAVNMVVKAFTGGDTGFFLVLVLLMIDEMSFPKPSKR